MELPVEKDKLLDAMKFDERKEWDDSLLKLIAKDELSEILYSEMAEPPFPVIANRYSLTRTFYFENYLIPHDQSKEGIHIIVRNDVQVPSLKIKPGLTRAKISSGFLIEPVAQGSQVT